MTANALRPVALALADAAEAQNLDVLSSRLDALLGRAGIVRTIAKGEFPAVSGFPPVAALCHVGGEAGGILGFGRACGQSAGRQG